MWHRLCCKAFGALWQEFRVVVTEIEKSIPNDMDPLVAGGDPRCVRWERKGKRTELGVYVCWGGVYLSLRF